MSSSTRKGAMSRVKRRRVELQEELWSFPDRGETELLDIFEAVLSHVKGTPGKSAKLQRQVMRHCNPWYLRGCTDCYILGAILLASL